MKTTTLSNRQAVIKTISSLALASLTLLKATAAPVVLTYTFPILNTTLGAAGTFWLYGVIFVLGGVFVFAKLPETNGRTLEEIERDLAK